MRIVCLLLVGAFAFISAPAARAGPNGLSLTQPKAPPCASRPNLALRPPFAVCGFAVRILAQESEPGPPNSDTHPFLWSVALRASLLIGVVALIVYLLRPRYDFVVTLNHGRVTVKGRASPRLRAAAADFFANDFPPASRLRVLGRYRPGRKAELQFRGVSSPGERQRIRNYLMVYL